MYSFETIVSLFPDLSSKQIRQLKELGPLYRYWNSQINVISRKDMEHFYTRHVLHSLSIGLYFNLDGHAVLDIGTGGGFPGVPLAILFPDAEFTLLDSIAKKLKVVNQVCGQIGVSNVRTVHCRMEEMNGEYRYLTGRAVKSLPQVYEWTHHLMPNKRNGRAFDMLYLKGGNFNDELRGTPMKSEVYHLADKLDKDPFFETKKLVRLY